MKEKVPNLINTQEIFKTSKNLILSQWLLYNSLQKILKLHNIDQESFLKEYATGVFDYFMGVIAGKVEIGNCPIMQNLLAYLKYREISADELFEICSHFRRSMIDFSYDSGLNSKEISDEISYIFDKNFRGILKFYTDTIFNELMEARLKADRASKAKEYFLSSMSHEIRTPLNAILGFVNILINDDITKKHRKYLDIILNSGENLLGIINDILDFSKLSSGEFTIEPKIFSLHDEIGHTVELFIPSAKLKNIRIRCFIEPQIYQELYADALRINQILSNFLSNAIKFTPDGGEIDVEAIYKDKILRLSVADSGIGIAQEDIQKIFIAFTQMEYGKQNSSHGTGLGLSICDKLAQNMGGSVAVESTYGKGSIFSLKIPVDIYSKESYSSQDGTDFKSLKYKITRAFKGHILIAEDNEANQELIKILLIKYGLTFDLASNGQEAIELYKENSYNLILMDEQMPIMNGNEALKYILDYELRRGLNHTPISALTANVIKGNRERGLLRGFDFFLAKPIILEELERLFSLYLKVDLSRSLEVEKVSVETTIIGLDSDKLKESLMLNKDELVMLVTLFIKKMKKQIPELQNAIEMREYKRIALIAHSIKGSSGNFRIKLLQESASEMEQMAKSENSKYDYEEVFKKIDRRVKDIKIS